MNSTSLSRRAGLLLLGLGLRPGPAWRWPSALPWAAPLLGLALLTGVLFVENLFAQHLVHKTLLACLAWVVFSVLLWGRNRLGWRGHKAIRWTLAGFCLLMLAYFGSKLVREYILHI